MAVEDQSTALAKHLLKQWRCPEPTVDDLFISESEPLLLDMSNAMTIVLPEWLRLFQNAEFSDYLTEVQKILDASCGPEFPDTPLARRVESVVHSHYQYRDIVCIGTDLLHKYCPKINTSARSTTSEYVSNHQNFDATGRSLHAQNLHSCEMLELNEIIKEVSHSGSTVQQHYGADLRQSLATLEGVQLKDIRCANPSHSGSLSDLISAAWTAKHENHTRIITALQSNDSRIRWLSQGGIFPCLSTVSILEQLRSTSRAKFCTSMKEAILNFALSITTLQRLLRIEKTQKAQTSNMFHEELANEGHKNWNPSECPDWLLLEIEANILIRPNQVEVARATIEPSSGSNSVLQMNMGQGKTSVIIPMVAAVLADTKRLVRVVVPKALLLQTAQLMQARIGGLLGREIRHVPFSRKTPTSQQTIQEYYAIHKRIMKSAGVMITLPEHIMSFMLSGPQRLSDAKIPDAQPMIRIQDWLRKVSRDILDECDALLAVRTQLIYPSGQQTIVDGHPHRWETAQALLRQVHGHLWSLKEKYPCSIEVVSGSSERFPLVFFLRSDVEEALISRVVTNVIGGQTEILPTRNCTEPERRAIHQFVTIANVEASVLELIDNMNLFKDNVTAKNNLYLLRGLLVHRILLLVLKKRWNVQYGLHPGRDPMAVPYHAKGVPSDQAEWGHPDVAILFTCLSFYFGGLNPHQLKQALQHLVKLDDPASQYYRWTETAREFPSQLRDWNVINMDDEVQLKDLWKYLAYNMVVIDYYLNHLVFPRHAKQFKVKLQASGWDIPLVTIGQDVGKRPKPLTTGFSGTNDNRTMLPLTIKQEGLPTLAHTNAEVLTYLLKPRNRGYIPAVDAMGRRLSEEGFLRMLQRCEIRILIDAGAHILEMDNQTLARTWLLVDHKPTAALYFGKDNRARIVYRTGKDVPLVASTFADDLSECLIYLDEAHTRGTDLKLPTNSRGALTLGPGQTKDHTVQAAMRMRRLGTTQSVLFVATPDVHQSILDQRMKPLNTTIDSHDVICWLIKQTCNGIEQLQPLYYSQGIDFCRRSQAAIDNSNFIVDEIHRKAYLSALRQKEHQTLEQLYNPKPAGKRNRLPNSCITMISAFTKELETRRKEFQDFGHAVHGSALQEVEQEREVAYEIETVREVQEPKIFYPLKFSGTHRDIVKLAETGRLPAGSASCEHILRTLARTALGKKYGINVDRSSWRLLASFEYLRTVQLFQPDDNFLRPVNWILWSTETETAIIVTPEEAEELIPIVRSIVKPRTHILSYAPPLTRKMLHFDNLTFYAMPSLPAKWTVPDWLKTELSIFSGRLYFEFDDYDCICRYLGQNQRQAEDEEEVNQQCSSNCEDGTTTLVSKQQDNTDQKISKNGHVTFTSKPIAFLQEWLTIRRKGQDFTHTPMGYICHGKPLSATHPFFKTVEIPTHRNTHAHHDQAEKENQSLRCEDTDEFLEGEEEDEKFYDVRHELSPEEQ